VFCLTRWTRIASGICGWRRSCASAGVGPLVDDLSFASQKEPWTPYSWLGRAGDEGGLEHAGGYRAAVAVTAGMAAGFVALLAMCCVTVAAVRAGSRAWRRRWWGRICRCRISASGRSRRRWRCLALCAYLLLRDQARGGANAGGVAGCAGHDAAGQRAFVCGAGAALGRGDVDRGVVGETRRRPLGGQTPPQPSPGSLGSDWPGEEERGDKRYALLLAARLRRLHGDADVRRGQCGRRFIMPARSPMVTIGERSRRCSRDAPAAGAAVVAGGDTAGGVEMAAASRVSHSPLASSGNHVGAAPSAASRAVLRADLQPAHRCWRVDPPGCRHAGFLCISACWRRDGRRAVRMVETGRHVGIPAPGVGDLGLDEPPRARGSTGYPTGAVRILWPRRSIRRRAGLHQ